MKKANGTGFEKEFNKEMQKHHYVMRLPTLHITQPADYIVVGDRFNFVELKETAAMSFSVSSMDQLSEVANFLIAQLDYSGDEALSKGHYILIVHFLSASVYKVLYDEQIMNFHHNRETLKPGSSVETYSTLEELCKGLKL